MYCGKTEPILKFSSFRYVLNASGQSAVDGQDIEAWGGVGDPCILAESKAGKAKSSHGEMIFFDSPYRFLLAEIPQPCSVLLRFEQSEIIPGRSVKMFAGAALNRLSFQVIDPSGNYGVWAGSIFDTGVKADTDQHVVSIVANGAKSEIRIDDVIHGPVDFGSHGIDGMTLGASVGLVDMFRGIISDLLIFDDIVDPEVANEIREGWLPEPPA